jgi:hypothetical protein
VRKRSIRRRAVISEFSLGLDAPMAAAFSLAVMEMDAHIGPAA